MPVTNKGCLIKCRLKIICVIMMISIMGLQGIAQGAAASPIAKMKGAMIKGIPHVRQKPDFCGEACVEMWLKKCGEKINQDDVFNASSLDPVHGRGCYAAELYKALDVLGFKPGTRAKAWQKISRKNEQKEINKFVREMADDLDEGIPSIVCMRYSDQPNTTEHFRLIVGYNPKTDSIIYHEPALDKGEYKSMKVSYFKDTWPLRYGSATSVIIRFRLNYNKKQNALLLVRKMPRGKKNPSTFSNADYAQHIRKLKADPVAKDLKYMIEKPFVIVGNQSPRTIRSHAIKTVRWATTLFRKKYFKNAPSKILTIWLFGDAKTYKAGAKKITGNDAGTPYGFFSSSTDSLVMNIATGGGTLVHEMFHAFIPNNFSECPAWFNEGAASLYEQCGEREKGIVGFTNWRLAGLKTAIKNGRTRTFKSLTGTSTNEFYGVGSGVHYAQSRYLCYYLQEKGVLAKYYHAFIKNQKTDPTGYKTLVATLGNPDMDKFYKDWKKWCLKLTYRGR